MGVRPGAFYPDGSFPGLPNDRAQQASSTPPSVRRGFSKKIKKHDDISFLHCHMHATAVGTSPRSPPSTGLLQRGGLPDAAHPLCLAAAVYPSRRRSLPLVARATHPDGPSPVLPKMVVAVVLVHRRLRPRRLESPGPGLAHVASAYFKCIRMLQVSVSNV